MASTTTPPPSSHIVITVGSVTISIPASIAAAPQNVNWTGPTGQNASAQAEGGSIEEAQQPAQDTVPRTETGGLEIEAHGTDHAPEGSVGCFTNLLVKRNHWLRAAQIGAINGLLAPASIIIGDKYPSKEGNMFAKANLIYYIGYVPGVMAVAMGEYMDSWSESARRERSDLDVRGSPNPWVTTTISIVAFLVAAMVATIPFGYIIAFGFEHYVTRVIGYVIIASLGTFGLGWLGARLWETQVFAYIIRILIATWAIIALIAPTIILRMDVSHGFPSQSDVPSIAAVVSSRHYPLISRYRAPVRTQSPKVEMIDSLFKKVSDTE
ncbi:argonaute 4-like protein, partial [Tanacetum coccineum]